MRANLIIPGKQEVDRALALSMLLTGLVNLNVSIMRRRHLPSLYKSGVFYCKDRAQWRNALSVLKHGCADCKSLSAYLAAEIITHGGHARVIVDRTGPRTLHARVESNGRILDPSKVLGM